MSRCKVPQSPLRRRLLSLVASGLLLAESEPLLAALSEVVVLTSYPDEVISRYEAAFEKAYPQYRLRIVWRMPHDALPTLRQPGQGGIDVYWSASPRNFALLKSEGAWRRLAPMAGDLPARIGNAELADPEGYYRATEMAGYGFAINPGALAALGLGEPRHWADLTDPRLAGRIALPVPSKVAFAQVLTDIVLQAHGWDRGWALWSEIAGLSSLIERGGTLVGDEVASGRAAIGLSLDFFVASAIANGMAVKFAYPSHGGINPGQVAVTASARNPDGGQAFAAFLLSEAGQKILTHPDIRKLPVLPSAYAQVPADYHNPFAAAERGAYTYDGVAGRPRLALVAAVFEQMLAWRHEELAALWRRVHRAEAAGKTVAAARRALETPPLSEEAAAEPGLRRLYAEQVEGSDPLAGAAAMRWRDFCARQRAEASRLLDGAYA